MVAKNTGKGALANDPKFVVGTDAARLKQQFDKWSKLAKSGDKTAKANLAAIQQAQSGLQAAPTPQQTQFNGLLDRGNNLQGQQFDQIDQQGQFNPQTMGVQQFNPGDFQQQFQGAYDSALNQFTRSSQPAFDKQKQDFQQMVAERGIDPTSKQYADMYKAQISDPQETARLNAQDTAYQTGLGAQNQAYGQAANAYGQNLGAQGQQFGQAQTQYQMPFQNLSALNPYLQAQYGFAQGDQNQQYAKELAALQQRYSMQNAQFAVDHRVGPSGGGGGGGGGGGMTLQDQMALQQDQMALQNNQFYNNMVLGGLGGGQSNVPSTGNAFVGGAANGVAAGITAGLAR